METKSSFEELLDFPKKNGLDYETHQDAKRFYIFASDPMLKTKYCIFKIEDIFFVAYDSYSTRAYMNSTFCGVYSLYNSNEDMECMIYKKDKLDAFLRTNKKKTGIKNIDDNLTITSDSKLNFDSIVNPNIILDYFSLCDLFMPTKILIQNDYLQFVKEFNGKKIIGVETKNWVYKYSDVEAIIKYGSSIIKKMKTRIS